MKLVWRKDPTKPYVRFARENWGKVQSASYGGTSLDAVRITREIGSKDYILYVWNWSNAYAPKQVRLREQFKTITEAKKYANSYIKNNTHLQPSIVRFGWK